MSGAIPPLPQYAFMAWCLVKAQGQLELYLYLILYIYLATVQHNLKSGTAVALGHFSYNTWEFWEHLSP
jgi:hypothetical protein